MATSDSDNPSTRRRWLAILVGFALLFAGFLLYRQKGADSAVATPAQAPELGASATGQPGTTGLFGTPAAGGPQVPIGAGPTLIETSAGLLTPQQVARERLHRAEEQLATYRKWAQYPPESRPASEHGDQLSPTAPVTRAQPLSHKGIPSQDVKLRLTQDRIAVVGQESVRLQVSCEDSLGKRVPCEVRSAKLSATATAPNAKSLPTPAVQFADDGRAGDEAAGDGTYTATVQPAQLGFAEYLGTLVIDLQLQAGGESGQAMFDIYFTPHAPATLTGRFREAIEGGSLRLYVGIEVQKAGRYLVAVRVDDANGKSFAFLIWNDQLTAGPHELPLTVFGKLIRDRNPAMPLRVRDLTGYLLLDDQDPDREHLSTLAGYQYTTSRYSPSQFSDAQWQSEERQRHETEFEKDVREAQQDVPKDSP